VFADEPTKVVCEDVGVAWAEFAGEWLAEPPRGEAVPVEALSGLPLFFDDLLESLALESCTCYPC
jgi:hypothetical protein